MNFNNGVYTVLVTPFTNENIIDYDSMKNWLDLQYNSSYYITGLVLLGTTSESPTLSTEEKINIVEYAGFHI